MQLCQIEKQGYCSHVKLQANHRIAAFTAVAVELLSMWLRTVLDDGKRNALKYFTLVRDHTLLTAKTAPRTGSCAGLYVPQ
jgi:hypothetical protein